MHIPSHLRFLVPGVVASALVTARPGPRLVPSQHYQQRLVTFTSRFTSWNTSFLVNYRFALALRTAETDRRNERSSMRYAFFYYRHYYHYYYYYLGKIVSSGTFDDEEGKERKEEGKKEREK